MSDESISPESIAFRDELYRRLESFTDSEIDAGPAHVVLSDYNLDDEFVDAALARATDEKHVEILTWIKSVPESVRCGWY